MNRVGIIYDPVYLEHDTGTHVENGQRLTTTLSLIEKSETQHKLVWLKPRPATIEELSKVHTKEYIHQIEEKCRAGGGWLDSDTIISKGSYKAAIFAAGAAITAVDVVMSSRVDNAFALVRPPGHHATCWHAMGFCLFNNIAVAAKHALCNYSINRVLIIDFDVHHGNGTQDAFYADSNVLYFSAHQCPLYPGTGSINEIGARGGEGFTVNAPLLAGWGDREYEAVFEDILAPLAMRFKPELILVSAGFDAHWADDIAQMKLSVSGFARLVEIIKVLSDTLCPGKLAFTLEGGYHLQALSTSILASLNILLGNKEFEDPLGRCKAEVKPVDLDSFIEMIQNKHQIKQ